MTKPIVSVVGNTGYYGSANPTLSKIIWDGAFIAPPDEQLKQGLCMPITAAGNAPYVHSYRNLAAPEPNFRVALNNYLYGNPGPQGDSDYWVYDATPDGDPNTTPPTPAWKLKYENTATKPNGLPFNPYAFANITYFGNQYLVAADYDSAGNAGGTLWLIQMGVNGNDDTDTYTAVTSLNIPNRTFVIPYQAHVQDVHVDGNRIFVLVIYSYIADPGVPTPPPALEYINSEVREYQLTGIGPGVTFSLISQGGTPQVVEISRNAVSLVPYTDTATGKKYLFIPCIGGMQRYGAINNGGYSSLSLVNISNGVGAEEKIYVGGTVPSGLHDFRGFAVATNGIAYILTGDYSGAGIAMQWDLYQTTAAALITLADAGNPGVIPLTSIASDTNGNAYFWAIGICNGGGNEYLVFAKGSQTSPAVAMDEVRFLKVGALWNSPTAGDNFTIPPQNLNGDATPNSSGFAINSMDISVPGGVLRLKTAHSRVHPAHVKAMQAKAEEERAKK